MSRDVDGEPLQSIIKNCQRLIADAELLYKRGGSSASACSLAIMAFEEAGKGHSHELEMEWHKKSKIYSQHYFRHMISAKVLLMCLCLKYDLEQPYLTKEQAKIVRERLASAKSFMEFASNPAPDEMRKLIGEKVYEQIHALPSDQRTVALVEMNWLRKVAKASITGEVEKLRQKGFYVDFNGDGLLSRPSEVTRNEAFKWIWAAKRSVNLLAFGIYDQPYSELAAFLENHPKPLPKAEEIVKYAFDLYKDIATGPDRQKTEIIDDEVKPYEPFGEWK